MALSIKARQVVAVTAIVGAAVVVLGVLYVSEVARVRLEAAQAEGRLLADAIYHRARGVTEASADPYAALAADPGLRSILQASAYSPTLTFAAIVDTRDVAVAHSDVELVGRPVPVRPSLDDLLARGAWDRLTTLYGASAAALEIRRPLLLGGRPFGTICIGVSALLTRAAVSQALTPALVMAGAAMLLAPLLALLLAQSLLRPIHLARAGLSRLGRGEFGVPAEITGSGELGEIGPSIGAPLPRGLPAPNDAPETPGATDERLDATLRHAQHLAAMSRMTAGFAHEIKNPLNAIAIHLELVARHVGDGPGQRHLGVIRSALSRLDDVVQGYLKFTRPDDLQLQPVSLGELFAELQPIVRAEAERARIAVEIDCPADLPPMLADPPMIRQALLNLALNACQAMPDGGTLRMAGRPARDGRVEVSVADTGTGIAPEHLPRVFDLYFTTKPGGSGMGLPIVFRTVRLHDGDIDVESSPGRGTTFRLRMPRA